VGQLGMTRIIQLALAVLCVGLLLIIVTELSHIRRQNLARSLKAAAGTTAVKGRIPQLDVEAAVAEILERPLFMPARQPVDVLSASNTGVISAGAPPQLRGRLAGMMVRPGARAALFTRAGQRPITVKVGGEIDGWKIAAIETDRVILSSDFGTQTVKPTNDTEGVSLRTATAETVFGMGMRAPTKSAVRDAVDPSPSARPSLQSSPVARQVQQ
jgi:hypothetical protein